MRRVSQVNFLYRENPVQRVCGAGGDDAQAQIIMHFNAEMTAEPSYHTRSCQNKNKTGDL